MTCEEAAVALPGCEPVPGSLEVRQVPANAEEAFRSLPSAAMPPGPAWEWAARGPGGPGKPRSGGG